MSLRSRVRRAAVSVFGPQLTTQYLPALRARGRSVRYDPAASWSQRYERLLADGELDDTATIKRGASALRTRYHYNAVENALLEQALHGALPERPSVLDVGAGSGHWIDFYRDVLDAREVVGIEISDAAADALARRYANVDGVTIVHGDVTAEGFALDRRFDVANAIDVLFHVVDDDAWRRTLRTLAGHVADGGRLVVGEHVGLVSHDAGFRRPRRERGEGSGAEKTVVTKRIRSGRVWRAGAREAGLEVLGSTRVRKRRTESTPANRLLVLGRRDG